MFRDVLIDLTLFADHESDPRIVAERGYRYYLVFSRPQYGKYVQDSSTLIAQVERQMKESRLSKRSSRRGRSNVPAFTTRGTNGTRRNDTRSSISIPKGFCYAQHGYKNVAPNQSAIINMIVFNVEVFTRCLIAQNVDYCCELLIDYFRTFAKSVLLTFN